MKLSKAIISILALSCVISFTGVQAHERHNDDNRLKHMTKRLDLTSEQQANISIILTNFEEQHVRPNREVMKAKAKEMKEQFATLMAAPTFDEATVKAQLEQRAVKHTNQMLNKIKLQHAIYQELTPEQQPLFLKSIEKKMHMKMKSMKKKKHRS